MAVKPYDLNDLRELLSGNKNELIDALNDAGWVNQVTAAELAKILKRGTYALEAQVGANTTNESVLKQLGRHSYMNVRWAVARNPNTPAEVLGALGRDREEYVRKAVAENPSTPAEVLGVLGRDYNEYVRRAVAQSPNTPAEVLGVLGRDSEERIREAVARNPSTPAEVFRMLATSEFDNWLKISHILAENPSTPVDVLNALIVSAKAKDSRLISQVYRDPLENIMRKHPRFDETDWSPYATDGCFPATARVLTATGYRPILDIEPGDLVVSYAPDGYTTLRPVTRKLVHGERRIQRVMLNNSELLRATANHKVLTTRGWLQVKDLRPGDELVRVEGRSIVVEVEAEATTEPVYNLYTAGEHTFVVEGLVVHNFTHLRVLRTWMHRWFVDPRPRALLWPVRT